MTPEEIHALDISTKLIAACLKDATVTAVRVVNGRWEISFDTGYTLRCAQGCSLFLAAYHE